MSDNIPYLINRYGDPVKDQTAFEKKWMMVWNYPDDIALKIPVLGKSIYINKDFQPIYDKFLRTLIMRGLYTEIKVNDQCFMVRMQRDSGTPGIPSIHSWGLAVDLNPDQNPLGLSREAAIEKGLVPFTPEFQNTAREVGLTCGIDFRRPDGMHFQMKF